MKWNVLIFIALMLVCCRSRNLTTRQDAISSSETRVFPDSVYVIYDRGDPWDPIMDFYSESPRDFVRRRYNGVMKVIKITNKEIITSLLDCLDKKMTDTVRFRVSPSFAYMIYYPKDRIDTLSVGTMPKWPIQLNDQTYRDSLIYYWTVNFISRVDKEFGEIYESNKKAWKEFDLEEGTPYPQLWYEL